MSGVLSGFASIWVVVGVGWLLAHRKILDNNATAVLSKVAFNVGLPALLFLSLFNADLKRIFSTNVFVSTLAISVAAIVYAVIARVFWQQDLGQIIIGIFAASYVNANNMGLPIAAYVIGDTSWVAPVLLIQVVFLQPVGLAILDARLAKREARPVKWYSYVSLPLRNPMTMGVATGVALNLLLISGDVEDPQYYT